MYVQHSTVNTWYYWDIECSFIKNKVFTNIIHTRRRQSTCTHLHNAKLLLWTLTFLCHKTLTTVEFRISQVSLLPSLLQYPWWQNFFSQNLHLLLQLVLVLVQTSSPPSFSFILVCFLWVLVGFFVCCGFFSWNRTALAKHQRYTQPIYSATKDPVIKWVHAW